MSLYKDAQFFTEQYFLILKNMKRGRGDVVDDAEDEAAGNEGGFFGGHFKKLTRK